MGQLPPGGSARIRRMLEIQTALFIAFLVVVFAVMIGIGWYGTTGGRGTY
jgi:hypothetical protein